MFKQEDVVELPKSEYEKTISQLMAVKMDNTAKNTIIEKSEAEIERLSRQVDELTPFHAFTQGYWVEGVGANKVFVTGPDKSTKSSKH